MNMRKQLACALIEDMWKGRYVPKRIAWHQVRGSRIDIFIGETLGLGGSGITYNAWDIQVNTALAIRQTFWLSVIEPMNSSMASADF